MIRKIKQLDDNIQPFLPISKFMMTWYFVIVITLIIDYFITIYQLCFLSFKQEFESQKVLVSIMIAIFMANILISLNTSFIDNGRIINNKKAIRLRYVLKYYLLLDLTVLITAIIQLVINKYIAINLFVFVRLVKVSSIDKLINKYVLRSSQVKFAYQILKHFILLLMICHFMGSFFFYLDIRLIQMGWYSTDNLWIYSSYSYNNIIDLPSHWQYAYSFYYAVVTLSAVAYGDLTPLNPTQALYTFFGLLVPLIFYTYVFSSLHALIKQRRSKSLQMTSFRRLAKKYLKQSGIQSCQIPKFLNYLSYAVQNKNNKMDSNFFSETAPSIKKAYMKVIIKSNYNFALFNPLLQGQNRMVGLQDIIFDIANEQAYPSKQTISVHKLKHIKLFYIANGEIYECILLQSKKYHKIIKTEKFLNQYSFFTGLAHRHSDHLFETKSFTIFQTIDLISFLTRIRADGLFFQSYHSLRNQLIFGKEVYKIGYNCFFCQKNNHFVDDCECLGLKSQVSSILQNFHCRKQYKRKSSLASLKRMDSLNQIKFIKHILKQNRGNQIEKQQKMVQTQNLYFRTRKPTFLLTKIDIVHNWSLFQKQYSF